MKLGTIIAFRRETLGLSEGEEYKFLSECGFDSVDYSLCESVASPLWKLSDDKLKEQMLHERDKITSSGMIVGQTHAPYDYNLGYSWMDTKKRQDFWRAQVQAIKATSYLGAPYMVVHTLVIPGRFSKEYYETAKQYNMEFFHYLKPYLEEYNVKVAIENMFSADHVLGRMDKCSCSRAEDLIDYIDTLNSDRFVACLDIGHAQLCSQDPVDMIYKLGKKYLHVLHVHDNHMIRDEHMFPGAGKGDWHRIGKALKDIDYEGVFSYEIYNPYYRCFPEIEKDMLPILHKMYVEFGRAITEVE